MKFQIRHLVFLIICLFISLNLTNAYPTNTVELASNDIKNAAEKARNNIKNASETIDNDVKNVAEIAINNIKNATKTVDNDVKSVAEKAISNIKNATKTGDNDVKIAAEKAISNIKNATKTGDNDVKIAAENAISKIKNTAETVSSKVKDVAQNAIRNIKNTISNIKNVIRIGNNDVKDVAEKAISDIKYVTETVDNVVKIAAEKAIGNINKATKTVDSDVKISAEKAISNINNATEIFYSDVTIAVENAVSNIKNIAETFNVNVMKAAKKNNRIIKFSLSSLLHKGNDLARKLGIDTAALGAIFLDMEKDDNDVYHADFNCWQSAFGYNKLYDIVFALGTSMDYNNNAIFSYNGEKYILWAWKGDYINLGAGAELGIYYGGSDKNSHWKVKKSLAMPMTLTLNHKTKGIVVNNWSDNTWWITAFNPKKEFQNSKADELIATYTVKFNDVNMFKAFQKTEAKGWSFNSKTNTATLVL